MRSRKYIINLLSCAGPFGTYSWSARYPWTTFLMFTGSFVYLNPTLLPPPLTTTVP